MGASASGHPVMITVAEAERLIAASLPRYPAVALPLAKCGGRILREPLRADRAQPPFDRVAMDGIAVSAAAWEAGARAFPIEGRQLAGQAPRALKTPGGCLEVMTGAVLPSGCDCVIPVEEIEVEGDSRARAARLREPGKARKPWDFVHRAGSDCAAGEVIVPEGVRLLPAHLGAAAAFGHASLPVAYAPSVAVIATGDELVAPDRMPLPHQIRRSNPYALEAALRARGVERVAHLAVKDDPARLRRALEGVLPKCDVLLVTGGVSMGMTDYVPAALAEAGVKPVFHKVRQKPGKPLWFGLAPGGRPVFALPGNPASVLVCLYRYVLPALRAAMGGSPEPARHARLAAGAAATGSLTQFRPVRVTLGPDGTLSAAFVENQGSGDFSGWARCDGFVELAAESGPREAGAAVPFHPW